MNANGLKKAFLGAMIAAAPFIASNDLQAQSAQSVKSDNVIAFNDTSKKTLPKYTEAVKATSTKSQIHSDKVNSLCFHVYGPVGGDEAALKDAADKLFNAYKPHLPDLMVTYSTSERITDGNTYAGAVYDAKVRKGANLVDDMVKPQNVEKVLGAYNLPINNGTASLNKMGEGVAIATINR